MGRDVHRQPDAGEPGVSDTPLSVWLDRDGALLRLRLNRPKANIVDAAMIAALREALAAYRGQAGVLAALLDAEGPHFSFGASVEEHLPAQCAAMLASLHGLIVDMLEWPAPILVAARGQCLGGGLEVAMGGSLIFAGNDAKFGQPEIRLGVFAPAASVLLPPRIGQAAAEEMLFPAAAWLLRKRKPPVWSFTSATIRRRRRWHGSIANWRARAARRWVARWPRCGRTMSQRRNTASPKSSSCTWSV